MNRKILFIVIAHFLVTLNLAHALHLSVVNGFEGGADANSNRSFYFPIAGTAATSCLNTVYPYSLTDVLTGNQQTLKALNGNPGSSDTLTFSIQADSSLSTIGQGSSVVIRVESETNPGQFYAMTQPTGIGYNGGSSPNDPTTQFYGTTDHQIETFGISLANPSQSSANGYCSYLQSLNAQFSNCQISNTQSIQSPTRLRIGLVPQGSASVKNTSGADAILINIVVTNCPPYGFTTSFSLTPEDGSVKMTDQSGVTFPNNSTIPLKDAIVYATPKTADLASQTPGFNAPIKQEVFRSPYLINNNLTNETPYCFTIGYTNAAGVISSPPLGNSNPSNNCATPSKIDGFLSQNACFIATAAYSDPWDPRLRLLRQFRGDVLYPFALGRKFIRWYYSWSPEAAHWISDHPQYKSMVKIGLLPVLGVAKTTLWIRNNMWVLSVAVFLSIVLLVVNWLWFRRNPS